jgi:hypothetical protein
VSVTRPEVKTDRVHVYFKQSEASKLADLNKGQTITIVGKCKGKPRAFVEIKDSFSVFLHRKAGWNHRNLAGGQSP